MTASLNVSGNVSAGFYFGDGSLLTNAGNLSFNQTLTESEYVNVGGDTMTGGLNITKSGNVSLYIHSTSAAADFFGELLFGVSNSAHYHASIRGIRNAGGNGDLGFFTSSSVSAYTNLIEKMRITNDGKVGIGTANPSHTFNVVGSGNFTGNVTIGGNLTIEDCIIFASGGKICTGV